MQQYGQDPQQFENAIHKHIMELEANQDAMHLLQASGYNQGNSKEDLWYSTSIQYYSYLYGGESAQKSSVYERQIKQILREWRHVLDGLQITEVDVKGRKIKTNELISSSDSLEAIESQLEAVSNATQSAPLNGWAAVRRRQLIRKEKNLRASIKENTQQVSI